MSEFWLWGLLCLVIAVGFVVLPIATARSGATRDQRSQATLALALHTERLEELAAALAAEELTQSAYDAQVIETQRLILAESAMVKPAERGSSKPGHVHRLQDARAAMAASLVASILLVGISLFWFGDFGASQGALAEWYLLEDIAEFEQQPRSEAGLKTLASAMAGVLEVAPEHEQIAFYLAQLRLQLGEHAAAVRLLNDLVYRYPDDSELFVALVEARYLAAGRVLSPELKLEFDEAIVRAPKSVTLLEILGMEAYKTGDLGEAKARFREALAHASGQRAIVIGNVLQNLKSQTPDQLVPEEAESTPLARRILVRVNVTSPSAVPDGATLFVFARAADGPPMPLAVVRRPAIQWPVEVVLDSTMAMMPDFGLSDFDVVEVIARISKSGLATPSVDDIEARSGRLIFEDSSIEVQLELMP